MLGAKDEKRANFCFQGPQLTIHCDYCYSFAGLCICSFIQQTLLNVHAVSGTAVDAGNTELLRLYCYRNSNLVEEINNKEKYIHSNVLVVV